MILKRLITTTLVVIIGALSALSAYRIHSVKGNVTVISGGKSVSAVKGSKILPSDKVHIPEGAVLEVINDINNTIYTSTATGDMTLTRLMLDSKAKASDNASAINSRLNFKGRSQGDKSNKVYAERGMVKRSLASFDPEASTMMVDAAALARRIISIIGTENAHCDSTLSLKSAPYGENASFTLCNTLDSPVYFNIIRISDGNKATISPLGQPSGSYILLPGQSMARADRSPVPEDQNDIIVATHYNYDIDELLEALSASLCAAGDNSSEQPDLHLPAFVRNL